MTLHGSPIRELDELEAIPVVGIVQNPPRPLKVFAHGSAFHRADHGSAHASRSDEGKASVNFNLAALNEDNSVRHFTPSFRPSKGKGTVRFGWRLVNADKGTLGIIFRLADKYILANPRSPHFACAAIILGLALVALS